MLAEIYPLQVLLMTFSGLVNRHQAEVIAYLEERRRDSCDSRQQIGPFEMPQVRAPAGLVVGFILG